MPQQAQASHAAAACSAHMRHGQVFHSRGISCAGKAGDWQRVMKLAEDMQNNGVARDVWTYASLIAACQSCGNRWKDALAFYQDMQDKGRPPVAACKG